MTNRILIIGSGFAGMWSALAAARAADLTGKPDAPEIVVLAPEARLGVRPRFYESDLSGVTAPLDALYEAAGVRFMAGHVERIDTSDHSVVYIGGKERREAIAYDRLVLASGSQLARPKIPGLGTHNFDNDKLDHAETLQQHLEGLVKLPDTAARNTAVVAGGGFTGIETAAELPSRLRAILGADADVKVIIVEQAVAIGPDLGPNPRPVIEQALRELGVTLRLGVAVSSIDTDGVTLADGTRIAARTVVWTGGLQASELAAQIPGTHDRQGRLQVEPNLRVAGVDHVFATGDVAFAACDDQGNHALMSCQHAMNLGRSAGHNAVADLVGLPAVPYDQVRYVTCLDLGPWGAVYTEGWDRQLKLVGAEAKSLKQQINTKWIYPPAPNRAEAFAAADPTRRLV
jgi:NADH:ubiquinone reductase (H+-translocating)